MWQAAFSQLLLETWNILWAIAAELWVGWWVLEPFRAQGPELGNFWLEDGCKVLYVMAGQRFATADREGVHPHPSSLAGDSAQRPRRALTPKVRGCSLKLGWDWTHPGWRRSAETSPALWITPLCSELWSPIADANSEPLPQIQAQQWERAALLSGPGRAGCQGEGAGGLIGAGVSGRAGAALPPRALRAAAPARSSLPGDRARN